MGPCRRWNSEARTTGTRGPLGAALALAMLVATAQVLLPACYTTTPTQPTYAPTDCTGVTVSTDPCDTSTAMLPVPDFPELPCPTRAEVDEIRRDIRVAVGSDVSAGVLACRERDGSVDLTVVENNVYQSLLFLRRMRFNRPLPWTNEAIYDWVRLTIPLGIVIESTGNSHSCLSCKGPIHVVYSSYRSLRPTVYYLVDGLIAHEARHAEGWPHTCGLSSQSNVLERDKSVAEMGGFGVHYLLAFWLGHYSEEPSVVREYFSRRAAQLLGGGSFCCECGGQKTSLGAAWLMSPVSGGAAPGTEACGPD